MLGSDPLLMGLGFKGGKAMQGRVPGEGGTFVLKLKLYSQIGRNLSAGSFF